MSDSPVSRGKVFFPEISGAEYLPDADRLILISDEHGVRFVDDAARQLRDGRLTPTRKGLLGKADEDCPLEDCEDAAYDGKRFVYLVTSHARNRSGEAEPSRCRLGRLEVNKNGSDLADLRHSAALWWSIQAQLPPLAEASRRTPANGGLNIEGLVCGPDGELVVGLRSPTVTRAKKRKSRLQEDAILLRIGNVDALFDDAQPAELADLLDADAKSKDEADALCAGKATLLNLASQGIRGLCYDADREAYWILSGLSADPNHDVQYPWALWLWDGSGKPKPVKLPKDPAAKKSDNPAPLGLTSPEAICLVPVDGQPHLLLIQDAELDDDLVDPDEEPDVDQLAKADAGCAYVLLPTDALKTK